VQESFKTRIGHCKNLENPSTISQYAKNVDKKTENVSKNKQIKSD
jgi:hypothetical protein